MLYLTHYKEYPIYYREEGGYYVAGNEAQEFYRLNSMKQVKRKLAKMKKDLEEDGFIVSEDFDGAWLFSKYIGEGESWVVEKVYGSQNESWKPYN